ncbi:MAG TPA: beta-galactosidase [Chloroflexota bacterium]|nr:beta-galactosidase [Chloroflexota bacterium]
MKTLSHAGKWKIRRIAALGAGAASVLALPIVSEVRVKRAMRPLTDRWQHVPVAPRGSTLLGISFRPPQVDALGLDERTTLQTLLGYPFQLIRLGAYWQRMEPELGRFSADALDWQIDAAERAGKQIILCVGAVKTFGYPEFFVPAHQLPYPLPEGKLVEPATHRSLLGAATTFITRVVDRYRGRKAIVAWQVEHEAVDPLGLEHSWRLAAAFVQEEVEAVRAADPTRPIMMNGFLPTSLLVRLPQWWRTRDQGDSLAVAQRLADIVGIDYYPRHALASIGARTLYLDGSRSPWQQRRRKQLCAWARTPGRRLMIAEGQAEPWEAVTTPPNPHAQGMYSCLPEQVIANYNQSMSWTEQEACHLYAYLFWGAEYWVLRRRHGDARYLRAFARVLEHG